VKINYYNSFKIFRSGAEAILLPPREHFRVVDICLIWLLNFQGSPRESCRHDSLIDMSTSSRGGWTTINNLTDRSRNPHCPCPITVNSIASQLVKNGTYKTKDRESDRLVNKEISDLWKIPTPEDKCISGEFTSDEFALASQQLKPGKAPGPDSICPEYVLDARSALKS